LVSILLAHLLTPQLQQLQLTQLVLLGKTKSTAQLMLVSSCQPNQFFIDAQNPLWWVFC
jgi:hypothetical protein